MFGGGFADGKIRRDNGERSSRAISFAARQAEILP
jgi:hypothetical protein